MSDNLKQSLMDGGRPYWVWGPLVFTSFYFLPLIFSRQHFSLLTGFISLVIYIAFILLYYKAANTRADKVSATIVLMITLCILGTSITPGTQALFGFIAFFCGFNFGLKKGLFGLIAVLMAVLTSAITFNYLEVYFIAPPVIVSTALFFMGRAERKDRIHDAQEKISQESIEQLATIAERERIARDMHDLIGHSLTSIALKAELAEKHLNINNVSQAKQEIHQVSTLSREILSQVRQAVSGYKTRDFNGQIAQLKSKLSQHNFTVQVTNHLANCSAIIESSLILMLTEAVTNILKHSNGNIVTIELEQVDDNICLFISDNGVVSELSFGNGLNGIRERCQKLNGTVKVSHQHGMSIKISLPGNIND